MAYPPPGGSVPPGNQLPPGHQLPPGNGARPGPSYPPVLPHPNGAVILARLPAQALGGGMAVSPGITPVFTNSYGEVIAVGRGLTMRQRFQVKERFDVNVAPRESNLGFQLPCKGDAFYFNAVLAVSWQVTDPAEVVRRVLPDGEGLLHSRLLDRLPRITREYLPHQSSAAENAINDQFGPHRFRLEEGLTVTRCFARVQINEKHKGFAEAEADQVHTTKLETARMVAVRSAIEGDRSGILLHLSKNPGDTKSIVDMIAGDRKVDSETRRALFQDLLKDGHILDVDLDRIRDLLLGSPSDFLSTSSQSSLQLGAAARPDRPEPPVPDPEPSVWRGTDDDR
jgi:hypothetical protein